MSNEDSSLTGQLAIQNGKLVVWPPAEGEPFPVLVPHAGVQVLVNGRLCTADTEVKPQDIVAITPLEETKRGTCVVTVSGDGLTATARVVPGAKIKRALRDMPPTARLTLVVDETTAPVPAASIEEIRSLLRAEGVVFGIQLGVLVRAANSLTENDFLVAEGVAPLPGTDARLDVFFAAEARVALVADEDDSVDFRERFEFTGAVPGQVLVKKTPAVNGTPGRGVRGETIPAPLPKEIQLMAGDGVVWQQSAETLVAVKSGRPVATPSRGSYKVHIVPDMAVRGNVDLATGNVSFLGDVSVSGDVCSGFAVWSGGKVRVDGVVDHGLVQALSSVLVRENIMSSQLLVGPPQSFVRLATQLLDELSADSKRLTSAVSQLKKVIPESKRLYAAQLISGLLDQRDEGFRARVSLLQTEMGKLDTRIMHLLGEELLLTISAFLKDTEHGSRTEAHIAELARVFAALSEKIMVFTPPEKAFISARNVVGSTLSCSGDIVIQGGCYNSKIQAGGRVEVQGVFRGGELRAGGDVKVKELGSKSGVSTSVYCPPLAKVIVGTVWENATVTIGLRKHTFTKEQHKVTLLIEEGNLMVR
jgi:hypothetical protein